MQNIGDTALHEAARNGHADVVNALLKKGAKVNVKNVRDLLLQPPPFTFRSRPYMVFVYI